MKKRRIRFLQTGDIHIGRGRVKMGEANACARGAKLLDTIFRVAREEDCVGVLITGDIFDTKEVTNAEREVAASKLVKYSGRDGLWTYVISGNHDQTTRTRGNLDYLAEVARTREVERLFVSTATEVEIWDTLIPGFKVIGAPCYLSEDQRWLDSYVNTIDKDLQYIFMGHGTIGGCIRNDTGWKPTEAEDKKRLSLTAAATASPNIIWWAYGDIHKRQKLPGLPSTTQGWYAGSPIQMDFGEEPDRGVLIVAFDVDENGRVSYAGKRYVRLDTEENGFEPFLTIKDQDQLKGIPANAFLKVSKEIKLSSEEKSRVLHHFKVIEDNSVVISEDVVNIKVVDGRAEVLDPLLANVTDVQTDVLSEFAPSSDEAEAEAKKVIAAAIARFQARTYSS